MAHTLYEDRDLNSGKELFEGMDGIKVDPEMVQLATQLVQRQAGKYDASDLEDRYETRLRALIDAKLKGEGIDAAEEPEIVTSNVVDLMATLKKSLGQVARGETGTEEESGAEALRGSGGDQALAQAGVIGLFLPAMDADKAPVLLEADDAMDLGLGHVTDLMVAKAAFWALKA